MTTATTRTPEQIAESYARQEALLRTEIAECNAALGLTDAKHKVTFGYLGNVAPNGSNDQRSWMVFLPHPGRVGRYEDHLGGFPTGSLEGIVAARRSLRALARGVALAKQVRA
jgi:hypothetical protein